MLRKLLRKRSKTKRFRQWTSIPCREWNNISLTGKSLTAYDENIMSPKGFHSKTSDPVMWFDIDICTPPVEEEEEEETKQDEHTFPHNPSEATGPPHNPTDMWDYNKKESTTTNEALGAHEANRQGGMKSSSPSFEYITDRPPVRLSCRPKAASKNSTGYQQSPPAPSRHHAADALFSSLRDITILNVSAVEMEDLIALSIRREQTCPGTGIHLCVTTMLHWTDTTLSPDSLPCWFTTLLKQASFDSRQMLMSYVSNGAYGSTDLVISKIAQYRDTLMHHQCVSQLVDLLVFLLTLIAAILFTLLTKVRESFRCNTSDFYYCDEEF